MIRNKGTDSSGENEIFSKSFSSLGPLYARLAWCFIISLFMDCLFSETSDEPLTIIQVGDRKDHLSGSIKVISRIFKC
jgi:hypothetical protein